MQTQIYTIDDYENLPESVHAELTGGQMYYRSTHNRMHQEILNFINTEINIYIRFKKAPVRSILPHLPLNC